MSLSKDMSLSSAHQQKLAWDVGASKPSILARLGGVAARWAEKRRRQRELHELYRFSDRELWDVGLSRSDILSIERGTFRRD